jgi:hypothetical protein
VIWVILGMHKSGTTLVSKVLHESGVNMLDGTEGVGDYDHGNKMERASTKEVNHKILASKNKFSLEIALPKTLNLNSKLQNLIKNVVKTCESGNEDWGFKDPRTCLTYPLWSQCLSNHSLIAVFRSPSEVWTHYWASARFYQKLQIFFRFIPQWCEYNKSILEIVESAGTPFVLIDYSELMTTPKEWDRLQIFVGRKLFDSRKLQMYRHREKSYWFYKSALLFHRIIRGVSPCVILSRLKDLRIAQVIAYEKEECITS